MPENKAEKQGRIARAEGKPLSSNPYDKFFPSDSDKRNKVDWINGWKQEDEARSRKAKR